MRRILNPAFGKSLLDRDAPAPDCPKNKNYRYGRGATLLKMGDPDEALREYGQALDLREKIL